MVVSTPPGVEGAVDVTVLNGLAEVVAADAFEYRSGDTRANPDLPSVTAPIVFGAFRNFVDQNDALIAQALVGRSTFTSSFSGNFTLTEFTSTELAPAIATFQHSGTTFQAPESLARAFLLLVTGTNALSDVSGESAGNFFRGFTNEENGVNLGATAFGPACFFPEPTGMQVSTVARTYWVNGIEANIGQGSVRQKAGWLELDDSLEGSATLLAHGRDFAGTAFDLGHETWDIAFTLGANGAFQGTRTSGDSTEPLTGRFSAGAELGFLIQDGSDDTLAFYLLTPIQHGVESGAFGGWIGGSLRHEIADDGLGGQESAFESGTTRGLIAKTATGSSELAFDRATRVTQSDPEGSFSEDVGARELDVSPSGRIFDGPDLAGFVNTSDGILLGTGQFPNECLLDGGVDRPIVLAGATFRESRKSLDSLSPARKQIAIEAKFHETATIHQQELGTDLFDVTLDPATPPTVTGVTVPLAGTIPALEAATITGFHKSTVRDDTGTVTTTRGDPPHWGVEVGYSFVDDTLDLFVTQITQANGRFAGAELPRWVGSGTLGNDGQVAVLRGNDEFLGDGLVFLVANSGTALVEPNYLVTAVGLAFEPNEGGLSGVTSARTELEFVGNGTVAVTRDSVTKSEDGSFASASSAGLGLNTAPSGQSIRINIPNGRNPDREWETFWTSTGDAFVGIDDTPGTDTVELVLGIRPAISGSFVDDDRNLIVLELDPQLSRATTQQLQLLPRSGPLLTGEIFSSRRDAGYALLPGQSFFTTTPVNTFQGEADVPIVDQGIVLKFLFNQRDEAAGQQELNILVTPRIIHSIDS